MGKPQAIPSLGGVSFYNSRSCSIIILSYEARHFVVVYILSVKITLGLIKAGPFQIETQRRWVYQRHLADRSCVRSISTQSAPGYGMDQLCALSWYSRLHLLQQKGTVLPRIQKTLQAELIISGHHKCDRMSKKGPLTRIILSPSHV
jgi:hypothetical protein